MPTYDYECGACGEVTEIFQPISEAPKRKCPKCGKLRLKRLIGGGAGFIFKGSGFYITDYRSQEYKEKAKAEASGEKGGSSSDSKGSGGAKEPSKESTKSSEPVGSSETGASKSAS